jgi:NADH:ubiquinone oxidoreductase subunit 6 (subunit J)
MTLYYIIGAVLAVWAVVVAFLGIKFDRFPGGKGGERLLAGISIILVAATVTSAIVLSAAHEQEPGEKTGEVEGGTDR